MRLICTREVIGLSLRKDSYIWNYYGAVPASKQIKVFTYPEFLCLSLIVRFSNSVLITPSVSAFVHCTLVNAFKSTVHFETTSPKAIVVL